MVRDATSGAHFLKSEMVRLLVIKGFMLLNFRLFGISKNKVTTKHERNIAAIASGRFSEKDNSAENAPMDKMPRMPWEIPM